MISLDNVSKIDLELTGDLSAVVSKAELNAITVKNKATTASATDLNRNTGLDTALTTAGKTTAEYVDKIVDIVGINSSASEIDGKVIPVNTIATLRAMTYAPTTVWVSGYHTKNDGAFGSNIYRWNPTSTATDNGGTIIKLTSITTGRYELQYSGDVNVRWFGAKGDGITDDTLAIQKAIDILGNFTHGSTFPGAVSGGGVVDIPTGKYKIFSEIKFKSGVNFIGSGIGTILYFTPSTNSTLFTGNTSLYSRNTQWDFVSFSNLTFVSTLLVLNDYKHNICLNLDNVQRWRVSNCYFEGFDTVITSSGAYYHYIEQSEFFNNRLCINMKSGAQPLVINGGVFWSVESHWDGYVAADPSSNKRPSEFIISEGVVNLNGTSIEPRLNVDNPLTFACLRVKGGSLHGCYTESKYPILELDANSTYRNSYIDLVHNYSLSHLRLNNFIKTGNEQYTFLTDKKSTISGSYSVGKRVGCIVNSNMVNGAYGFSSQYSAVNTVTFDKSIKVLGSSGVMKCVYGVDYNNQQSFNQTITSNNLDSIRGRTIHVGVILKGLEMNKIGVRAQDTPLTVYKEIYGTPFVDYGDGWGLYVTTVDISESTNNLTVMGVCSPKYTDGRSIAMCGGLFVWDGGIEYTPYATLVNEVIFADTPPSATSFSSGIWKIGDRIYNRNPIAGSSEGWVCIVSGEPGTWKAFGSIEA